MVYSLVDEYNINIGCTRCRRRFIDETDPRHWTNIKPFCLWIHCEREDFQINMVWQNYPRGPILVEIVLASFSLLCGLMMLVLIQKSHQNGFILILRGLTVGSIIYCMGFYFTMYDDDDGGGGPFLFITMYGDILMACWTFILSINLFRIVFFLQSARMEIEVIYYRVFNFVIASSFVLAMGIEHGGNVDKTSRVYEAFYWFRLCIVVINLLLYNVCAFGIYLLPSRVARNELSQYQADGIAFVVHRLRYYSLAQVIVRIGALWFDYNAETMADNNAHYFDAFLGPSSGFWYFIVFLTMQPDGLELFKKTYLYWLPPKVYGRIQWCSISLKYPASRNQRDHNLNDANDDRESDYFADFSSILAGQEDLPRTRPISSRISQKGIDLSVFNGTKSRANSAAMIDLQQNSDPVEKPS